MARDNTSTEDDSAKMRLKIHLDRCSNFPTGQKNKNAHYISFLVTVPGAEAVREKSSEKYPSASEVVWGEDIYMNYSTLSLLRMRLYAVRRIKNKIVCETTVSISDMLGKDEGYAQLVNSQTGATFTLHLSVSQVQDEGRSEMEQVVAGMAEQPFKTPAGAIVSSLDPVAAALASAKSAVDAWQPLLDKIEAVMKVTEAIAEIHPYTKIAFSVISAGYKLAQGQKARDENVSKLISALYSAYDLVVNATDLKSMPDKQRETLERLTKHIINCGHFIVDYAKKPFWGRAFSGIASSDDDNIAEYRLRFDELGATLTTQGVLAVQRDVQIILGSMDGIANSVDLLGMKYSRNARWRSGRKCLPGTQSSLLSEIEAWAHDTDDNAPRVLLLTGVAGVGKSSIANTIAGRLEGLSRLGASYCFDRNDTANLRPDMFFPTVARHLADTYPAFKHELVYANSAATFGTADIEDQFDSLVKVPLERLGDKIIGPVVFVVDAVDESASLTERRKLLSILANRFIELPSNFHLFLTSRPEIDVQRIFGNKAHVRCISISPTDNTSEDIRAFVDSKLVGLDEQPLEWCSSHERDQIVSKAEGLFQWVFVACRTIVQGENLDFPPSEEEMRATFNRLILLPGGELDALYHELLSRLFPETYPNRTLLLRILGLVAESCEPLMASSLVELLHLSPLEKRTALHMLAGLGALMTGVSDEKEPIRTLHSSFRDFLTDAQRSDRFYIDPGAVHLDAAHKCLRLLNAKLRFNMCGLETSYMANKDVVDLPQKISDNVPISLAYASRFWGHHVQYALPQWSLDVETEILTLLHEKFPFWLEMLSILGAISTAPLALTTVHTHATSNDLRLVARDCRRFVRVFGQPISHSAPHVYLSALALAPRTSLVHQQPYSKPMHLLARISQLPENWPQTEVVMNVSSSVSTVAISPDGRRIASGSFDDVARIWDAETGALIHAVSMDSAGPIPMLASTFSPDGARVLFTLGNNTLQILDTETGLHTSEEINAYGNHVLSAAFSRDGHFVAFGSQRGPAGVWDADTGLPVHAQLEGHDRFVGSVAFSPDGRWLGSSDVLTIRIWEVETGVQTSPPLEGHMNQINCIVFSPDSRYLASGSADGTIRIWGTATKLQVHTPLAHSSSVEAVTFSPNGCQIASSSSGGEIYLWNLNPQMYLPSEHHTPPPTVVLEVQPHAILRGHNGTVRSLVYSPDGCRIISGSYDDTIRIWDVDPHVQTHLSLKPPKIASAIFCPGDRYIMFRAQDDMILSWDSETSVGAPSVLVDSTGPVTAYAVSPNCLWVASGLQDGRVQLSDVRTGAQVHLFESQMYKLSLLIFSPDSRWIAYRSGGVGQWISSRSGGPVCIRSVETGKLLCPPIDGPVTCAIFSEDSRSIIIGSEYSVRIWDVMTGALVSTTLLEQKNFVFLLALAPNGRWFSISVGNPPRTEMWDTRTGARVHELPGVNLNSRMAFSPDSRLIVSGSGDQAIQIWDAETGSLLCQHLIGHISPIMSLAFSPNGRRVVSTTQDVAGLWDLEIHEQSPQGLQISLQPPNSKLIDPSLALQSHPCTHAQADSTTESASPLFHVAADGWIQDVSCSPPRLLLWIPPDVRPGLYLPLPSHFISPFRVRSLELSNFAHGARWTECYDSKQPA